jgi:3-oxoacyl-[acyl-carrier-protein] synthase II
MLCDRLQIVITGIGFRSALGDLASTWQGLLDGRSALEILPHSPAIAGAVETPITPLTIAGFAPIGALATTGCYPFDI